MNNVSKQKKQEIPWIHCMISIIVPIYNADTSLERCINSILRQSYADFELILVNDGSKDSSENICLDFKRVDNRIIYIKKENGGVSSARNVGLRQACGEYVTFIDSDDYVEENYLEQLMIGATCDFVLSGFHSTEGISFVPRRAFIDENSYKEKIPQLVSHPYLLYTPWAKLYKSSLLKKANLIFDESLRLYEDTIFVLTYLAICTSISIIPYAGYEYIGSWGGVSKYKLSQKEVEYRCKLEYDVLTKIEKKYNCHIDKYYRCYAINYLDGLIRKHTDRYCLELYQKYHTPEETNIFLHDIYFFPSYNILRKLKNVCGHVSRQERLAYLESLHHFFTLPIAEMNFNKWNEKLLYVLIKCNHLKSAFVLLKSMFIIKSMNVKKWKKAIREY